MEGTQEKSRASSVGRMPKTALGVVQIEEG